MKSTRSVMPSYKYVKKYKTIIVLFKNEKLQVHYRTSAKNAETKNHNALIISVIIVGMKIAILTK
jgi:hypothetical protein